MVTVKKKKKKKKEGELFFKFYFEFEKKNSLGGGGQTEKRKTAGHFGLYSGDDSQRASNAPGIAGRPFSPPLHNNLKKN